MIEETIWVPKTRRQARIHQRRARREREGELIQIDGSPHDWFEGRAPEWTLIVYIDDATGKLKELRFAPSETTKIYMETLQRYLTQYGRPASMYSDKHSIFRVNAVDNEDQLTQFGRALNTLDIELIHANTPQAKGRVERANKTLQDRLVKEMRLRKINSIETANAFLPEFMEDFNRRFAVTARTEENAHRPVLHDPQELALILTEHHTRTLSKNLTLQFEGNEYQLQGYGQGYALRGAKVRVCKSFSGGVALLHQGKVLRYRTLNEGQLACPLVDEKSVHEAVDQAIESQQKKPDWKPAVDHPWKGRSYQQRVDREAAQPI